MIESTDLKHSSKKAWALMQRLLNNLTTSTSHTNVTANEVAQHVLLNGKCYEQLRKSSAYQQYRQPTEKSPSSLILDELFSDDEQEHGMSSISPCKAAGIDDILPEFILILLNSSIKNNIIPKMWSKVKISTIFKSGNDPSSQISFHPISLLCVMYKLDRWCLLSIIIVWKIRQVSGMEGDALASCLTSLSTLRLDSKNGLVNGLFS